MCWTILRMQEAHVLLAFAFQVWLYSHTWVNFTQA